MTKAARRHVLRAAFAFLCLALFAAGPALAQGLRPFEPLDPAKAQSLPFTPLSIESGGKTHVFQVEVAATNAQRATGLMHRNFMPPDRGMVFDFKREQPVRFWMRNTFIPLDMIFITSDGVIAAIAENAVPHSEEGVGPPMPVQAVLELAGGTSAELGIKPGDTVRHAIFKNERPPVP